MEIHVAVGAVDIVTGLRNNIVFRVGLRGLVSCQACGSGELDGSGKG